MTFLGAVYWFTAWCSSASLGMEDQQFLHLLALSLGLVITQAQADVSAQAMRPGRGGSKQPVSCNMHTHNWNKTLLSKSKHHTEVEQFLQVPQTAWCQENIVSDVLLDMRQDHGMG